MPPPSLATAVERGAKQLRRQFGGVGPHAGGDHQLDRRRQVGPGQLGVATDAVVLIERQQRHEPGTRALEELEAKMVGQRAEAVVVGGIGQQLLNDGELVIVERSASLDAPHGCPD